MDYAVLQYELLVITMYCQKSILLLEGTQVKNEKKKKKTTTITQTRGSFIYIYINKYKKVKNRTLE